MSKVLVFPSAFFGRLKDIINPLISTPREAILDQAHEVVAMYDNQIWGSSLILLPANFDDHWVLLAVCNACEASSAATVPPPTQETMAGDDEPDGSRFCMLTLNSLEETPRRITRALKMYLDYSFKRSFNAELQFVKAWNARVRGPLTTPARISSPDPRMLS